MGLFEGSSPFAMVAGWAGCSQVDPFMGASLAAWNDMVNRQLGCSFTTILAGVIISPENLSLV